MLVFPLLTFGPFLALIVASLSLQLNVTPFPIDEFMVWAGTGKAFCVISKSAINTTDNEKYVK